MSIITQRLRSRSDWDAWFPMVQSAAGARYWAYFDPDGLEAAPVAPPMLTYPWYQAMKKEGDMSMEGFLRLYQQNGGRLPNLAAASQSTSNAADRVESAAYDGPSFDDLFQGYAMKKHDFEAFDDAQSRVKLFIWNTVDSAIGCQLVQEESVRQWLKQLKRDYEPDTAARMFYASEEYQDTMSDLDHVNLGDWTVAWSNAVLKAGHYQVPEVINGGWLRDLARKLEDHAHSLAAKATYDSFEGPDLNDTRLVTDWADNIRRHAPFEMSCKR